MAESETQYLPIYPTGGFRALYPVSTVTGYSLPQTGFQDDIPQFWLLRFYIPPAANGYTALALFCPQKQTLRGCGKTWAQPPQCDLSMYTPRAISTGTYLGLPWDMGSELCNNLGNVIIGYGTVRAQSVF